MLPGLRFLFAAIVLSMSMLVFGLGATALLRAAHEEFASTPSWHASPEPVFAQRTETPAPVLAMLRAEPPAAEENAPDQLPAAVTTAEQRATGDIPAEPDAAATPPEPEVTAKPVEPEVIATPAEPEVSAGPPEPERTAALQPEDSSRPEIAKPEMPATESPARQEAAPAQTVAPAATDETEVTASTPTSASEEVSAPASEAAPAVSEQAGPPASADADIASTKIATLGGAPVTIETPPAKTTVAKHRKSSIKKRVEARRKTRHRRMALRARILQQPPQPIDPFGQAFATARRR